MARGPSGGVPDKGAWEKVESGHPQTTRLAVPGGWVYYLEPMYREPAAVFVPEPPGHTLNCPKCNNEPALEAHCCPLRPQNLCTCGASCSGMCRLEGEQS